MDIVKLSSKGQVVIPKSIRDDMRLPAGTEFIVSVTATGLALTPTTLFPTSSVEQVQGMLAKSGRALPDDAKLKAQIKTRLKDSDDASKA